MNPEVVHDLQMKQQYQNFSTDILGVKNDCWHVFLFVSLRSGYAGMRRIALSERAISNEHLCRDSYAKYPWMSMDKKSAHVKNRQYFF
jgi:hypothetical protein